MEIESLRKQTELLENEGNENVKNHVTTIGPYMIWDSIGIAVISTVGNYLAKHRETGEFFVLKIVKNLDDNSRDGTLGKILIHSEYTILKILEGEVGVTQQHGLFKDVAEDENGHKYPRLCLVVDCYWKHDFSPEYTEIATLADCVGSSKLKHLKEEEALDLFVKILLIVQRLHSKNIVHHDLKLGNIVLNKATRAITLANFCLAKQLFTDGELINDQRGSPAYAPPELIEGTPYDGKAADMWSLGVVLYAMLYGTLPFAADNPKTLFGMIKDCNYKIPTTINHSAKTVNLVKSLLQRDTKARPSSDEAIQEILEYYPFIGENHKNKSSDTPPQVVPEVGSSSIIRKQPKLTRQLGCLSTSQTKSDPQVLSIGDLTRIFNHIKSESLGMQKTIKGLTKAAAWG